ncbi:hypothetical protein [Methylobacterium haplocladii]|uniref:Uncharacterized protein n=1 Tax=Methylobacterium haplocladii TaxID=1176176 RepID=A0A512IM59_9HYPH|nr:hypothetical protein [Methylobacterium haplocladii]GEO98761.1 hypothetical protein MHA02_11490 [Methylobacterium haplocladii]GJD85062.1 hypothetical protein HPGCJGGD_2948 [Methylobacterium haplocladii]GLS59246.1 hypothetical protein GCM10007887_19120 [Methylobacterium haplocladii]
MSDFTDLVARAVSPSMSRQEREAVYGVVRQAVLRLQERENLDPGHIQASLQVHLVEETIRDVESDIVRFLTMKKMQETAARQDAEAEARAGKRR